MSEARFQVGDFVRATARVDVIRGLHMLKVFPCDVLRVKGEYGGVVCVEIADKEFQTSDVAAYFGEFYVETKILLPVSGISSPAFPHCG